MRSRQLVLSLTIMTLLTTVVFAGAVQRVAAAETATLRLIPSTNQINQTMVGGSLTVNLTIENVQKLWLWAVELQYDPAVLNFSKVDEGPFLTGQVGSTLYLYTTAGFKVSEGRTPEVTDSSFTASTASGTGTLAIFTFKVESLSNTEININVTQLLEPADPADTSANPYFPPIAYTTVGTTLTVSSANNDTTNNNNTANNITNTNNNAITNTGTTDNNTTSDVATDGSNDVTDTSATNNNSTDTNAHDNTPLAADDGPSMNVYLIVGAGAIIAVLIALGAFVQRRKH